VETAGAVNMPLLEIDPAVADHTTDVLLVPVTVAENCCVLPDATVALNGLTLTLTFVGVLGGFTVTVANALASADAALVAVTVMEYVAETVGAVNKPALEMDPAVVDQVTAVLLDPLTVAKNC
jgi:hypothetical protein